MTAVASPTARRHSAGVSDARRRVRPLRRAGVVAGASWAAVIHSLSLGAPPPATTPADRPLLRGRRWCGSPALSAVGTAAPLGPGAPPPCVRLRLPSQLRCKIGAPEADRGDPLTRAIAPGRPSARLP